MSVTIKNHINPCLWIAIWSKSYYERFLKGEKNSSARSQVIHYLEINSNKHLIVKTENVHYEKNLGIADLPKDKVLEFCQRHYPEKLDEIKKDIINYNDEYLMDFENIFSLFEKIPLYSNVLSVARTGKINNDEQKAWLSMFLTHHVLRTSQYLNALIDYNKNEGIEKFETLITLKWSLEGKVFLTPEIMGVFTKQWTIYRIDKMLLPLSDFPIISTSNHIFAPLAPDVLLAVATKKEALGLGVNYEGRIPPDIFKQFMHATINKTAKGLVFSDEKYLKKCQESIWWFKRRKALGL